MKRITFLILLVYSIGYSQEPTKPDSLSKYSYFTIRVQKEQATGVGTGFFIRNKANKLFFVTNYHVATGNDPANNRISDDIADYLWIRLGATNEPNTPHLVLKVTRNMQMEKEIALFLKPDLYAIPVDIDNLTVKSVYGNSKDSPVLNNLRINEITNMVDTKYVAEKSSKIFIYGFPSVIEFPAMIPTGELIETTYFYGYKPIEQRINNLPRGLTITDILNRYMSINFLISNSQFRHGFSGSPVFGEFNKGKSKEVKFIGIGKSGIEEIHIGEIIKADQLLRYINSLN